MARRARTVIIVLGFGLGLTAMTPAATATDGQSPGRACVDAVCATANDYPSVCWHGGRDDGAVCFSAMPR